MGGGLSGLGTEDSGCGVGVGGVGIGLMFLPTISNSWEALGVEKAYRPSLPGHFLPASNEKTSPSQPYFLRYFSGHCQISLVLLSVYIKSLTVTSIRPF